MINLLQMRQHLRVWHFLQRLYLHRCCWGHCRVPKARCWSALFAILDDYFLRLPLGEASPSATDTVAPLRCILQPCNRFLEAGLLCLSWWAEI